MTQKAHRFVSIFALLAVTACGGGSDTSATTGTDAAGESNTPAPGPDEAKVQPMLPDSDDAAAAENPGQLPAPLEVKSHKPADYPDLKIEVVKAGEGETLHYGGTGEFEYTGMTLDGVVFDSSLLRQGTPYSLLLDMERRGAIEGWILGLQEMKLGEERRLMIPPELAYGERGSPPSIPGNATLVFRVKLLKIVDAGTPSVEPSAEK